MVDEQLEFLISQYADGSLPESERALLELRLRDDAEGRALLAEYRALDGSLKAALTVPAINWERLADHLSEAVAAEQEARAATVLGRIGTWGKLAVAACVVLAVGGVALWSTMNRAAENTIVQRPTGVKADPPPAPPQWSWFAALRRRLRRRRRLSSCRSARRGTSRLTGAPPRASSPVPPAPSGLPAATTRRKIRSGCRIN